MILACPKCGKKLQVSEEHADRQVRCPDTACAEVFPVSPPDQAVQASMPLQPSGPAGPPKQQFEPIPSVMPSSRRRDYRDDDYYGDDDYDEYDDGPRAFRKPKAKTGLQTGFGIASLVVGGAGLIVAMIPCFGYAGVIFGGIGLLLGVIGITVSFAHQREGMSMPATGAGLSAAAILLGVLWIVVVAQLFRNVERVQSQLSQAQNRMQMQMQKQIQQQRMQVQQQLQKRKEQNEIRRNGHPQVLDNLKTIGIAMHDYYDVHGCLPASGGKKGNLSWRVGILPHMGPNERRLYEQFRHDEPWNSPHNKKLLAQMPEVYGPVKNAKIAEGSTHFQVFTKPDGPFELKGDGPNLAETADGTSNTLLVGEANNAVPWTKPADLRYDKNQPVPRLGAMVPTGFHAVKFDAAACFIRNPVNQTNLRAWITDNGGEIVPPLR